MVAAVGNLLLRRIDVQLSSRCSSNLYWRWDGVSNGMSHAQQLHRHLQKTIASYTPPVSATVQAKTLDQQQSGSLDCEHPVSTRVSQTLHARDLLQLEYICMRASLCHVERRSHIGSPLRVLLSSVAYILSLLLSSLPSYTLTATILYLSHPRRAYIGRYSLHIHSTLSTPMRHDHRL